MIISILGMNTFILFIFLFNLFPIFPSKLQVWIKINQA